MPNLLIVDDEPDIHRALKPVLAGAGWTVLSANSAAQALNLARMNPVTIVLLDLGLPDIDGKAIITKLQSTNPLSIIVVSARHQESEKVAALDAGADDYVDKPFGITELLARIRAAERRAGHWASQATSYEAAGVRLDVGVRRVELQGEEVHLSPKEFELLRELIAHAGQVVTHRRLLMAGWGDVTVDPQYLRSYVATLRQKLEEDAAEPRLIRSEPGVGYRFGS